MARKRFVHLPRRLIFTAVASLTVGAASISASATVSNPEATAALTVGAATVSASATYTGSDSMEFNGWVVPASNGLVDVSVYIATATKVVYVDSSKADDSGDGLSEANAKKTIAAGAALIVDGQHHILLLKRGGTWTESIPSGKGGLSATEPLIYAAYGTGARPLLKTGSSTGMQSISGTQAHVIIQGIEFYAHTRDPNSPDFVGSAGGTGIRWLANFENLMIEDCVIRFYIVNLDINNGGTGIVNLVVRRCVSLDSYSTDSHSQGMFMKGVTGATIEDNFLDHNGWNEQVAGAEATVFNHNFYLSSGNFNVIVRRNIGARASSHGMQLRSGGLSNDNLFVNNSLAATLGNSADLGVIARNDVILEGKNITTELPRGFGYGFYEDVESHTQTSVLMEDCIFAHRAEGTMHAINLDVAIAEVLNRNIVYDWSTTNPAGTGTGNAILTDNEFALPAGTYVDPTRSMGSYNGTLGGTATLAAFLADCRTNFPNNGYDAISANAYIRAGFAHA